MNLGINKRYGYLECIINEGGYNVDSIIRTVKALERIMYERIYVIDCYKNEFIYTSYNLGKICGMDSDSVKNMGYNFYVYHMLPDDIDVLLKAKDKALEFLYNQPIADRVNYSISCNLSIIINKRERIICHKVTPLALSKDGKIWLVMCAISLGTGEALSNIIMKKSGSVNFLKYSIIKNKWEEFQEVTLNNIEVEVLMLSAQGYTMTEIAKNIHKSIDTVKAYKKSIFQRMNVINITEALTYAQNHQLI